MQVYQPSEEELRGFLDPYENVICTECHQGGDDGLMLLCDLCDSPAHTYCVGLGRIVPDGNWYCEGCRPSALGLPNSQPQSPQPDQRLTVNSNLSNETSNVQNIANQLDLNSGSIPDTSLTQQMANNSSPGYHFGDQAAASPVSGQGVSTLSGRRRIHRQIRFFLSSNRMSERGGRINGVSSVNLVGGFVNPQSDQRQPLFQPTRSSDLGTSYHNFFDERVQENHSSPVGQNRDNTSLSARFEEGNVDIEPPLHQCSRRLSIGSDGSVSPCANKDGGMMNVAKEQLQSMVRSHLKSLSTEFELGMLS